MCKCADTLIKNKYNDQSKFTLQTQMKYFNKRQLIKKERTQERHNWGNWRVLLVARCFFSKLSLLLWLFCWADLQHDSGFPYRQATAVTHLYFIFNKVLIQGKCGICEGSQRRVTTGPRGQKTCPHTVLSTRCVWVCCCKTTTCLPQNQCVASSSWLGPVWSHCL